ncbi:TetR/AcrR family transcriptional regulator [Paenibacillus sp. CAA11]|uniref:TetR/AcrR family transcriptional regulator n=1 Tax=Paenibacillus sp. CAA11 TaxID=1532905 RepID=UPI000D39798E|nr:TetR/AcrR family transcriptional regulator [Paenibacillus sp. CAA11]AWB45525.1 TetR/AcrR family transcriptional regulator [Paenibacillus sp. CAA11]
MNDQSWHQHVKNKNREDIIESAKELFFKDGFFLQVSVKDVCSLAGISRVTFYKHFSSMDDLIFEVQMTVMNEMVQYIESKDRTELTGRERLGLLLHAWIDYAQQYKRHMKFIIFFDLYYEADEFNDELRQRYESFIRQRKENHFLKSVIVRGMEDGSIREDADPNRTGMLIFTMMMGLLQRMSITQPHETDAFEDIAVSVVGMVMRSIEK